jgi:hypothetical protein
MPFIHSAHEENKPVEDRVYHEHPDCPSSKRIKKANREFGADGYRPCTKCHELSLRDEIRTRSKPKP